MPKNLRLTTLLLFFLIIHTAQAKSLWGDGGFSGFTESLPPADSQLVERILGVEWTNVMYRSNLDPRRVHRADFGHIDALLDRAVEAKLGVLELFTAIELSDPKAPALLLDEDVLEKIDAKYDLSSVWMLSAKPKDSAAGIMKMRYMIVGQGVLIMGYPHPAKVEIFDDGKFLEYQYQSVISAKIVHNEKTRGLFSVRTLASPSEEFSDFKGPMGVSIRSYEVKGNRVHVEYHLVIDQETEVPKRPIIIRSVQGKSSP